MSTILLTGANGNVSSAIVRELQGSGHKLVGLVREPIKALPLAALGVELRTGDLSDLRTVENAFTGVDVASSHKRSIAVKAAGACGSSDRSSPPVTKWPRNKR
jgi:uncharacterized protein YbjT (DUF2867 family)